LQSVILVGGKGTRLRPLTYDTPKQMLPLVGVAMIECVMESLAVHGVTEAVLSLGYLPDRFIEAYPSGLIKGVRVTYVVEPEPLDTAGAIRFAAERANIHDTFLVVNGDVLSDINVTRLFCFHREHGALATISLTPVEDPSRFGVVSTAPDGRVLNFVEKPPRDEAPTNEINAGYYVFEPDVLEHIASDRRVSVEREVFPALALAKSLYAVADDAYWLDTGTPTSYLRANIDLLNGRHSQHNFVGIREGSWSHTLSKICSSAQLVSSVVDRDCIVGEDVVLENSVLLPGSVVEDGCVIRSSIVGYDAVVGARSQLGATCVIGPKESVPAHSQLSGDIRLGRE